MGFSPFPLSGLNYVSKWVEVVAIKKNDAKTMIKFLKKNIFLRFRVPRILISDRCSHFCNSQINKVLKHYLVRHSGNIILKLMDKLNFSIEI